MLEYIVVTLIVLACAVFLGRRFFGKKATACGGCNRCGGHKRCP